MNIERTLCFLAIIFTICMVVIYGHKPEIILIELISRVFTVSCIFTVAVIIVLHLEETILRGKINL